MNRGDVPVWTVADGSVVTVGDWVAVDDATSSDTRGQITGETVQNGWPIVAVPGRMPWIVDPKRILTKAVTPRR